MHKSFENFLNKSYAETQTYLYSLGYYIYFKHKTRTFEALKALGEFCCTLMKHFYLTYFFCMFKKSGLFFQTSEITAFWLTWNKNVWFREYRIPWSFRMFYCSLKFSVRKISLLWVKNPSLPSRNIIFE